MDFLSRGSRFDEPFDLFGSSDPIHSDYYETNDEYILEIDLPGYQKENMNIHYHNGYLNVMANKEETRQNVHFLRKERYVGNYERTFYVGSIDDRKMKASYQNGILIIHMPKVKIESKEKSVRID